MSTRAVHCITVPKGAAQATPAMERGLRYPSADLSNISSCLRDRRASRKAEAVAGQVPPQAVCHHLPSTAFLSADKKQSTPHIKKYSDTTPDGVCLSCPFIRVPSASLHTFDLGALKGPRLHSP